MHTVVIDSERSNHSSLSDEELVIRLGHAFGECEDAVPSLDIINALGTDEVQRASEDLFLRLVVRFVDLVAEAAEREHLFRQLAPEVVAKATLSKLIIFRLIAAGRVVVNNG